MMRSFIAKRGGAALLAQRRFANQRRSIWKSVECDVFQPSMMQRRGSPLLSTAIRAKSDRSLAFFDEDEEIHSTTSSKISSSSSSVTDGEIDPMTAKDASVSSSTSIDDFNFAEPLRRSLTKAGITSLFPVQSQSYEAVISGRDMIAKAPTGSGKTLAFAIPIVQKLLASGNRDFGDKEPRALVVSPTRELAIQIEREFKRIAPQLRISAMYGGVSYNGQISDIRRGIDVVVGTPGRLIDLMSREGSGALRLGSVDTLVLDEADEMLKMGFQQDVDDIMSEIPESRQLLLWSATVPQWVRKLMRNHMTNPASVDLVGEGVRIPSQVRNIAFASLPENKAAVAQRLLTAYAPGGRALIFCNTKASANELSHSNNFPAAAPLHGDLSQGQRESVLRQFHKGEIKCLMATDVAARGLDIKGVELVVHYELPEKSESFVHRTGRTGRAGKDGINVVLYNPGQERDLRNLMDEVDVKPEMPELPVTEECAIQAAKLGRKQMKKAMKNASLAPEIFRTEAARLLQSYARSDEEGIRSRKDGDEDADSSLPEVLPYDKVEKLLAVALMETTDFSQTAYSRLTGQKNMQTLLMRTEMPHPSRRTAFQELEANKVDNRNVAEVASCRAGVLFDVTPLKAQEILQSSTTSDTHEDESDGMIDEALPIFSIPESLPDFRIERRQERGFGGGRYGRRDDRRRFGGGRGDYREGGGFRGRRGGRNDGRRGGRERYGGGGGGGDNRFRGRYDGGGGNRRRHDNWGGGNRGGYGDNRRRGGGGGRHYRRGGERGYDDF